MLETIPRKTILILLSLLVVVGLFLRLYNLSQPSYWIDEGYTINAVQATLDKGYPLLDSGWSYNSQLVNTYLISFSSVILGENELGYRIISVIFGTLLIILIFIISHYLFRSKRIALLASFLTTFASWEILWSRQSRGYILLQFFYLLSAYFTAKLLNKWSYKDLIFLLLSCLAAYFSHPIGIISFPAAILVLTIKYLPKLDINHLKNFKYSLPIATGLIICVYFLLPKTINYFVAFNNKDFFLAPSYLKWLIHSFPLLSSLSLLAFLYLVLIKKYRENFVLFFFFLVFPLTITITANDHLQFRYLFYLFPFLIILSSFLVIQATNIIKNRYLQIIIAILLITLTNISAYTFFPKKIYSLEYLTPQPDFKSAYQDIKKNWEDGDIIISPYTPLDEIYLGQTDYWLKISLSGKKEELEYYEKNPYDRYNRTPLINNLDELKKITQEKHGFILIDEMALNRLGQNFFNQLKTNYKQIHFSDHMENKELDRVWVFEF